MLGKNEAKYVIALCPLVLMFLGLFDINDLILHCVRSCHYWLIFGLEQREKVKGESNMDRDSEL